MAAGSVPIRCQFGIGAFLSLLLGVAAGIAYVADTGASRSLLTIAFLTSGALIGSSQQYRSVRGLVSLRGQAFSATVAGAIFGLIFSSLTHARTELAFTMGAPFVVSWLIHVLYWTVNGALLGCCVGCVAAGKNRRVKADCKGQVTKFRNEIVEIKGHGSRWRLGLFLGAVCAVSVCLHLILFGALGSGNALLDQQVHLPPSALTVSVAFAEEVPLENSPTTIALPSKTAGTNTVRADVENSTIPPSQPFRRDESTNDKFGSQPPTYEFRGRVRAIQGSLPFQIGDPVSGTFVYNSQLPGEDISRHARSRDFVHKSPALRLRFQVNDWHFETAETRIETYDHRSLESLLVVSNELQVPADWKIHPIDRNPSHFAVWFQNSPSGGRLAGTELPAHLDLDWTNTPELRIDFSGGVDSPNTKSNVRTVFWANLDELKLKAQ